MTCKNRLFQRFEAAQRQAVDALGALYEKARAELGEAEAEIFSVHQLMAEDEDFADLITAAIAGGAEASEAVRQAGEQCAAMFSSMDDAYMRERAADVQDVAARIRRILRGEAETTLAGPCLIAAEELTPSQTVQFPRAFVQGFLTARGAANSHTGILARTLGVPAVSQLPVDAQLQLIRAMQPDAKTIGILYTTSEPNSVYSVGIYEDLAADYGFTIDAVGVTAQSEVTQGADTLISHGVDCFSNLTDNNVVGVLPSILEKTNAKSIPVYGSEIEQVKKGCVASIGIDYYELGRQTGQMAAKVLKGEATCEEMPYETISEYGLYVNYTALTEMGLTLPEDYAARAIDANA